MKKIYVAFVVSVLVFSIALTGCGVKERPDGNTQGDQEIENQESELTVNYKTKKEVLEVADKNIKIFYPQIKGYPGELLMDYMNQSLKKITDIYIDKEQYKDVQINYEITKMDEKILSVVFKGTGQLIGYGAIKIQHSMNLDMTTANEIDYGKFVKSDEKSSTAVMKILDEKAKEIGIQGGLEAEGIRIYFKGEDVIFYYMPLDDSAKEFIELSIPIKDLEGYVNTEFGPKPAS